MYTIDTFNGFADTQSKPDTLDHMFDLIRTSDTLRAATHSHRLARENDNKALAQQLKSHVPCFAVAVRFSGGKGEGHITGYTGLTLVDLDGIDPAQMAGVVAAVKADPHTHMAYITLSGHGLRIIARYEPPSNLPLRATLVTPPSQSDTPSINRGGVSSAPTHPEGEHQQSPPLFIEGVPEGRGRSKHSAEQYKLAFVTVNEYYRRLTGVEPDLKCSNPTRISALAHDPDAYYNPDAEPFDTAALAAQYKAESRATARPVGRPKKGNSKDEEARVDCSAAATLRELEHRGVRYEPGNHNKYISDACYLMNRYGVSLEDCTEWALKAFPDYAATDDVPAIVRSCYTHTDEHATRQPHRTGKKGESSMGDVRDIRRYLEEHGIKTRQNVITHKYEIYDESTDLWYESTDRMTNTLCCRITEEIGKRILKGDFKQLVESEFSPEYNPLAQYLDTLPPIEEDDTTDYIDLVASMVHVAKADEAKHRRWFKKWFVAMLATWLDPKVTNHVILTYIGPQGIYKSTFMRRLMPPALDSYFAVRNYASRMDKDDRIMLAEKGLVALEEIDSLTPRELNQLKAIVTAEAIDERDAYSTNRERRYHLASFCATGNNRRFLTDLTGNRRWLPFYVTDIDSPYTHAIPHDRLYAQAYALYRQGFQYWFDPTEVAALDSHNRNFEEPNMTQELIETYFRPPYGDEVGEFYTSANILTAITTYCGGRVTIRPRDIYVWMNRLGYKQCRVGNLRGWNVIVHTGNDIHDNHRINAHRSQLDDE